MKCPKCDGRGFTELEHGLIMVECDGCGGKGEIDDSISRVESPRVLILPHYEGDDRPLEERAEEARRILEGADDNSDIRVKPDNQLIGSGDTSQPKQPRKQKAKTKTRARAG